MHCRTFITVIQTFIKKQENTVQDIKGGGKDDVIQLFRACPVLVVSACGSQYHSATYDTCRESHNKIDFPGGASTPWDR